MSERLKLGEQAPDFKLPAVDGLYYSLDNFKMAKALVIIFSCNHCPYVQAYEERIKTIQDNYMDKGVNLVAINSNDDTQYPDDSFDEMKKRAKEKQFNFPYLRDDDQAAALSYGASHTPEIFLFDKNRKLVYQGKIDDNWKEPDKVQNKYLADAIDELLEGKEISVPETWSIGCTIKWKTKGIGV